MGTARESTVDIRDPLEAERLQAIALGTIYEFGHHRLTLRAVSGRMALEGLAIASLRG